MNTTTGEAAAVPQGVDSDANTINPHFLNHVVASASRHDLEASEDIVSGNGIKLLAKGARIDDRLRERLLLHKLAKPLEDCMAMPDGLQPRNLAEPATRLLERHELLERLCAAERDDPLPLELTRLSFSGPVQSLLTVYAEHQAGRLDHALGVALVTLALARRLMPGRRVAQRELALAALLHDVGELYLDPAYLQRGTELSLEPWRHIASHPVIGYRVLAKMPGAGPVVAEAVLNHHERLDGFGYPRGVSEAQLPLGGHILALSEWLMGLLESGQGLQARTSVAAKLIPGEFGSALLEPISAAARACQGGSEEAEAPALPQLPRIVASLQRMSSLEQGMQDSLGAASPALKAVLEQGLRRLKRILSGFTSAGLDVSSPTQMLDELAREPDPALQRELMALLGEFGFRLREMERACLLRASLLGGQDLTLMQALVQRLHEGEQG